jgi:hypothetical protein
VRFQQYEQHRFAPLCVQTIHINCSCDKPIITLDPELAGPHHLNVAHQCNLTNESIVDRRGALDILEPNRSKQRRFWWDGDTPHLHAEANHAFNHVLLSKFASQVPDRISKGPLWRLFLQSRDPT